MNDYTRLLRHYVANFMIAFIILSIKEIFSHQSEDKINPGLCETIGKTLGGIKYNVTNVLVGIFDPLPFHFPVFSQLKIEIFHRDIIILHTPIE